MGAGDLAGATEVFKPKMPPRGGQAGPRQRFTDQVYTKVDRPCCRR